MIEQNRGHIKAANVLQKYHNSRLERMNTLERDNALEIKTEIKDIKLSDSHKSHLANFRSTKLSLDLFYNIFYRFQRMAVGAKGNVRISRVLHETKLLSKKFKEKKKIYK